MYKRITVITESKSGRNKKFHDNLRNIDMTDKQFVDAISKGKYPNYHIRKINGIDTPVSNPDSSTNNNLN